MWRKMVVDRFDCLHSYCLEGLKKPRNSSWLLLTWPRFELALSLEPTCSSKFVYRLIDRCAALLEMVIDEHEEVRQWLLTHVMCELGREALNAVLLL